MHPDNNSTKRRFAGSYFASMISIMLVLFVLGMYAFMLVYADNLLTYIRENIGFEVVMKSDAKETSIMSLKKEMAEKDYVKSVEYISKEDATNRMKEDLGEDFLQWLGDVENPLLPSLDVRFVSDYANSDSMAMVEKWICSKSIVKEVVYQKSLTNTINDNINKIKIILFAVSLILLLISITLISHTIRLLIYSKRFTVRTMCLVGATDAFIMRPFVKSSMKQGLVAAVMALILMTIVLYSIKDFLPEMDSVSINGYIFVIYLSVIVISLLLTLFATIFSMKRYLNADIDKFYV